MSIKSSLLNSSSFRQASNECATLGDSAQVAGSFRVVDVHGLCVRTTTYPFLRRELACCPGPFPPGAFVWLQRPDLRFDLLRERAVVGAAQTHWRAARHADPSGPRPLVAGAPGSASPRGAGGRAGGLGPRCAQPGAPAAR